MGSTLMRYTFLMGRSDGFNSLLLCFAVLMGLSHEKQLVNVFGVYVVTTRPVWCFPAGSRTLSRATKAFISAEQAVRTARHRTLPGWPSKVCYSNSWHSFELFPHPRLHTNIVDLFSIFPSLRQRCQRWWSMCGPRCRPSWLETLWSLSARLWVTPSPRCSGVRWAGLCPLTLWWWAACWRSARWPRPTPDSTAARPPTTWAPCSPRWSSTSSVSAPGKDALMLWRSPSVMHGKTFHS